MLGGTWYREDEDKLGDPCSIFPCVEILNFYDHRLIASLYSTREFQATVLYGSWGRELTFPWCYQWPYFSHHQRCKLCRSTLAPLVVPNNSSLAACGLRSEFARRGKLIHARGFRIDTPETCHSSTVLPSRQDSHGKLKFNQFDNQVDSYYNLYRKRKKKKNSVSKGLKNVVLFLPQYTAVQYTRKRPIFDNQKQEGMIVRGSIRYYLVLCTVTDLVPETVMIFFVYGTYSTCYSTTQHEICNGWQLYRPRTAQVLNRNKSYLW